MATLLRATKRKETSITQCENRGETNARAGRGTTRIKEVKEKRDEKER